MRRKDREVTDPAFFRDVFDKAELITVAFNDGKYPYCVPLNFVALGGALYFHCAPEGHKLDCMERDPHVHFNTCDSVVTEKEKATAHFRSVSGTGRAVRMERYLVSICGTLTGVREYSAMMDFLSISNLTSFHFFSCRKRTCGGSQDQSITA